MPDIDARAFGSLEATVEHLTETVEKLERQIKNLDERVEDSLDRIDARLSTLNSLLDQARGVRIVLVVLMGCASFAAGIATAFRALR